jgi:hypothetical protein
MAKLRTGSLGFTQHEIERQTREEFQAASTNWNGRPERRRLRPLSASIEQPADCDFVGYGGIQQFKRSAWIKHANNLVTPALGSRIRVAAFERLHPSIVFHLIYRDRLGGLCIESSERGAMNLITRIAVLLGVVATVGFAATWTGELVRGRCFVAMEDNIGPDGPYYVDRDIAWETRDCAPRSKTHVFEVVQQDEVPIDLDSQGNAQCAALVRKYGTKPLLLVQVVGKKTGPTVKVNKVTVIRVLHK